MSNRAITWAFDCDVQPSAAKFVLVALADFADEENTCYPSQDRIASMTGQSRASVLRHLKALEESGHLVRTRRSTSEGYRTSDRFTLLLGSNVPKLQFAYLAETGRLSCNTPRNLSNTVQQEPPYEPPVNPQRFNDHSARELAEKLGAAFAEFWAVYPRKVGKPKAQAAFKKAAKRATLTDILEGARRYASDANRVDEFTKHPTTWLNADGWLDGPLPARSGGPRDRQGEILQREMDEARRVDMTAGGIFGHVAFQQEALNA